MELYTDIPALVSGASAADGNALTHPGGFVHNVADVSILQTDTYFSGGTINFYSATGSSIDKKTYANLVDHYNTENGNYNLWVKFVAPNIVMALQYALDKKWMPFEYLKNVSYFGGTPVGFSLDLTWDTELNETILNSSINIYDDLDT